MELVLIVSCILLTLVGKGQITLARRIKHLK
jgi:hypothetical protein